MGGEIKVPKKYAISEEDILEIISKLPDSEIKLKLLDLIDGDDARLMLYETYEDVFGYLGELGFEEEITGEELHKAYLSMGDDPIFNTEGFEVVANVALANASR
ncbi:hypothetical protein HNP86_002022 [Methanococcus maripaludis]|uniref:Uncharacterized protein n=1 Tax=Methanococcus maripaludis TaxID=39152 RepID=A0A7J9NXW5_METMI|nr:hypothetical protein [Methanococcus maripaludis]MBA2851863.1 hypothetical protein [Methanococcus maripaludis]